MSSVLALDIGGTKLAAALVSATGEVSAHREVPTPPSSMGADHLAATLTRLAVETAACGSPVGAAIAAAGPLDLAAGTISPVNIAAWRDFDVVSRIAKATGLPTVLIGDALAAAVAEHWLGAATGSRALLGIVVSTGIGGGLVLNGGPFPGPSGNAGHLGHVVVDPAGPPCSCGARGCVEAIASGPATLRWAHAQGWPGPGMPALAEAAKSGEEIALAAFDRAADALAAGLVATSALCDLDTVVVGGGVAAAGEVLLGPLRERYAEHATLPYTRRTRIVQARLGRHSGLIGAARHALTSL